eukprot:11488892-Alexandrium_andersonii.AAC.1
MGAGLGLAGLGVVPAHAFNCCSMFPRGRAGLCGAWRCPGSRVPFLFFVSQGRGWAQWGLGLLRLAH